MFSPVHSERGKTHLGPTPFHYRPEQSKGQVSGKIMALNESFAQEMNITIIITHFCMFTQT